MNVLTPTDSNVCVSVLHRQHGLQQAEEGPTRLLDHCCWTGSTKLAGAARLGLGLLGDAEAKPAQAFLFKFPSHCIPSVKRCYTRTGC